LPSIYLRSGNGEDDQLPDCTVQGLERTSPSSGSSGFGRAYGVGQTQRVSPRQQAIAYAVSLRTIRWYDPRRQERFAGSTFAKAVSSRFGRALRQRMVAGRHSLLAVRHQNTRHSISYNRGQHYSIFTVVFSTEMRLENTQRRVQPQPLLLLIISQLPGNEMTMT
jgi:hypothetical protein